MTFDLDSKVRNCAEIVKDTLLLAKLAGSDMIALESKYHLNCLMNLYRSAARVLTIQPDLENAVGNENRTKFENFDDSLAFAEIIDYLEEARDNDDGLAPVFKLSEIVRLFGEYLQRHRLMSNTSHDLASTIKPNSTRFKERLLANLPNLTAVNHGKEVLLTFPEHLWFALEQTRNISDINAINLLHTAKLIRKDIFDSKFTFNGSLDSDKMDCEIPEKLFSLITLLLDGPGGSVQSSSKAATSISQLIIFNAVKTPLKTVNVEVNTKSCSARHQLSQETAVPVIYWDDVTCIHTQKESY